jgi:hypothetical protein
MTEFVVVTLTAIVAYVAIVAIVFGRSFGFRAGPTGLDVRVENDEPTQRRPR